jgi:hypothetical protein
VSITHTAGQEDAGCATLWAEQWKIPEAGMLRPARSTGLALALLAAMVTMAQAELSRMTWSGTIAFDPNTPVPGGTAATLWSEFYGQTAVTGQVPVSGTLVFDTAAPVSTQNYRFTSARNAVREMTLQLGQVTVAADFARIGTQAHLSGIGSASRSNGAFCTSNTICDDFGLVAPGWGNHTYVVLESQHFSGDRDTGMQQAEFGSAFGALVGDTPQFGDFTPTLTTQNHGVVAVNAMSITVRSFAGQPHFRQLRVPHLRTLIGAPPFEEVGFSFTLETQGVPGAVLFSGTISTMNIDQ